MELSDQGETSAKRTKKESPRLGLLKQALGVLKKSSEKNMEERSGDPEVQHFCKFIASKLEKYSKNTQNMLQFEIFDLFRKADSGYYEYYNNNYGRSYGYNSRNVTDNVTDSHATEEQNRISEVQTEVSTRVGSSNYSPQQRSDEDSVSTIQNINSDTDTNDSFDDLFPL